MLQNNDSELNGVIRTLVPFTCGAFGNQGEVDTAR